MARTFFINGPALVKVDGAELGLSDSPIQVTVNPKHLDIVVNAFGTEGGGIPPEIQQMLADVTISMSLVHIDRGVLDTAIRKSMGGGSSAGTLAKAGTLMGANSNYMVLGIASPDGAKPWRFPTAYLAGSMSIPLGVERSIHRLDWRAVPFISDPWNGGVGAQGVVLWDYAST